MPHLDTPTLNLLQKSKNLLAFSAGVDSSALFFLLVAHDIKFDIALVNYGTRKQSTQEQAHAKALAKKYKCFCHTINAPTFESNFEANARAFRYGFFDSLIAIEGYDTLLTAHQLDDQLEWLLMRLCKGAGACELIGLEPFTSKKSYTLVRPLLNHTKASLLSYLKSHNHPYFIDESNSDERYERNHFRKVFASPLLEQFSEGIARSITYLRADKQALQHQFETLFEEKSLKIIFLHTPSAKVKATDMALKHLGYLLSASQREEIKTNPSVVIGGVWAVESYQDRVYIAPYRDCVMPKTFKEQCREANIPTKIRPYLFEAKIEIDTLPLI